jgi:hypothetical protein
LGDGVLGGDGVVEERRVECSTCPSGEHSCRGDDLAHHFEDPFRTRRTPEPRLPVGEDGVVEARIVEGETTGDLPADAVP